MAVTASNDFLRFSAYSIKDLITRKLTEDANFTDQVYEGSNLAILIDIVSYMYQCLIYNLNNSAAESMFSDTQIYENISRLCKFIGYHPAGFKPATLNAAIANNPELSATVIYPFTAIDTGLYDTNANKIYFSLSFDPTQVKDMFKPMNLTQTSYTNLMLLNGRWKHYQTVFEASGIDYETFVLDGIQSDSANSKYVANNGIQVFVEDSLSTLEPWMNDPNELFIQAYDSNSSGPAFSKLYDNTTPVYSTYLNENKTFEIKFGNGITGRRLNPGDRVHVMYLDTNGPDGYISLDQLPTTLSAPSILKHDSNFFGISQDLYDAMFNVNSDLSAKNIANYTVGITFNTGSLSRPQAEQNVEQIRNDAPAWFKTGNRLITKKDYEFFVKSNNYPELFPNVIDAVCMNNWDYMTTFYRWLFNMGINPIEEVFSSYLNTSDDSVVGNETKRKKDPYKYLSKTRLVQHGYEYVDSADANNIYLWIAGGDTQDMALIKDGLNNRINNIKTMTSETYALNPVNVYFDISFTPTQLFYDNLVVDGNSEFDYKNSYLEITVSDNTLFSNIVITTKVQQIIEDAFYPSNCQLGQIVDYSSILNKIYQINGVTRVRTVYYPEDYLDNTSTYEKYKTRACDGIAFASWSNTGLIDIGDDLQINNTIRTLEKFQFPRLAAGIDVRKKIKVIRQSMNTINPVKF